MGAVLLAHVPFPEVCGDVEGVQDGNGNGLHQWPGNDVVPPSGSMFIIVYVYTVTIMDAMKAGFPGVSHVPLEVLRRGICPYQLPRQLRSQAPHPCGELLKVYLVLLRLARVIPGANVDDHDIIDQLGNASNEGWKDILDDVWPIHLSDVAYASVLMQEHAFGVVPASTNHVMLSVCAYVSAGILSDVLMLGCFASMVILLAEHAIHVTLKKLHCIRAGHCRLTSCNIQETLEL